MDKIILVDSKDRTIGFEAKEKCHDGDGILHRAFSIFIFNDKNQLLIQQRSKFKRLWPLFWSNSCCSHPRVDEDYKKAAGRRLKEELGILCKLRYLYKFKYKANYKQKGSENEICAVLMGRSNDDIIANPEEIADYKWAELGELKKDMGENPNSYTPWFKMEIKEVLDSYRDETGKI